jgi:hypothetical protein
VSLLEEVYVHIKIIIISSSSSKAIFEDSNKRKKNLSIA